MNTQRFDFDRALIAWFEDGPTQMSDRVVDGIATRIARQPQRRTWRVQGRLHVSTNMKLAAALAAGLAIAVAGWQLLPRTTEIGGQPTPAPTSNATTTPTAAPTPTAVACDDGTAGCLGKLDGGTYSSANFKPKLTYTVPDGPLGGAPAAFWNNSLDLTRTYTLVPAGGGQYSFSVQSEVAIPAQTPDCSTSQQTGVGNTVEDWVAFVTEHPGLDAQAPVAVTVGGFSGFRVDFARAASWTAECSGPVGPVVMMFMHPGHDGVRWTDDQQESFWFLDVDGETVIIALDSSPSAADHARDLASAQPIIDSFQFTP